MLRIDDVTLPHRQMMMKHMLSVSRLFRFFSRNFFFLNLLPSVIGVSQCVNGSCILGFKVRTCCTKQTTLEKISTHLPSMSSLGVINVLKNLFF